MVVALAVVLLPPLRHSVVVAARGDVVVWLLLPRHGLVWLQRVVCGAVVVGWLFPPCHGVVVRVMVVGLVAGGVVISIN